MGVKTAPLKLGWIGCGEFSQFAHLSSIRAVPELRLTAMCDVDEARLGAVASQCNVTETYTDFRTMLDRCELDCVGVVGSPALHVEAAKELLRRQIPFFTEKPISTNVEDAREVARIAAKYGDCGQIGYTSRYSPAQRLAWKITRSEEFGPISDIHTTHLTQCHMHPFWDIEDPVEGLVYLHGVHAIDLWRFFGGDPVEVAASVSAKRRLENGQYLGSVMVYVRTADGGPHGTIHMKAGAAHNGDVSSDVGGEHARVRVDNGQSLSYECNQRWIKEAMAGDPLEGMFLAEQPTGRFLNTGMVTDSYFSDFFRFEWIAFARALIEGKPLSPSTTEGCKTACLTDAICQSLRRGGEIVKVDYGF